MGKGPSRAERKAAEAQRKKFAQETARENQLKKLAKTTDLATAQKVINHNDPNFRQAGLSAVFRLDAKQGVELAKQMYEKDSSPNVRITAFNTLGEAILGGKLAPGKILPFFEKKYTEAATAGDKYALKNAISSCLSKMSKADAIGTSSNILKRHPNDPGIHGAVLSYFARTEPQQATAMSHNLLKKHEEPGMRIAAYNTLELVKHFHAMKPEELKKFLGEQLKIEKNQQVIGRINQIMEKL